MTTKKPTPKPTPDERKKPVDFANLLDRPGVAAEALPRRVALSVGGPLECSCCGNTKHPPAPCACCGN